MWLNKRRQSVQTPHILMSKEYGISPEFSRILQLTMPLFDGALDQRRLLDRQLLNTLEAYCKISYKIVVCKSSDGKIYQKIDKILKYTSRTTILIGSIIMGARVLNTRLAPRVRCRRGLWMPKHVNNSKVDVGSY